MFIIMFWTNSRSFAIQTTVKKKLFGIYQGNFEKFYIFGVKVQNFQKFQIVDVGGGQMFSHHNRVFNKLWKFRCWNIKKKKVIPDLWREFSKLEIFKFWHHHIGPYFQIFTLNKFFYCLIMCNLCIWISFFSYWGILEV